MLVQMQTPTPTVVEEVVVLVALDLVVVLPLTVVQDLICQHF